MDNKAFVPTEFTLVSIGTLVTRSEHWLKEQCNRDKGQFGILVDKKFYEEDGKVVCYPVIWWEGQPSSSTTHPWNATVVRKTWK